MSAVLVVSAYVFLFVLIVVVMFFSSVQLLFSFFVLRGFLAFSCSAFLFFLFVVLALVADS